MTSDVTEGAPPSSGTARTSGLRQEFVLGRARRPVRPQSKHERRGHRRQRQGEGRGQVITPCETLLHASPGDQRRGSKGDAVTTGSTISNGSSAAGRTDGGQATLSPGGGSPGHAAAPGRRRRAASGGKAHETYKFKGQQKETSEVMPRFGLDLLSECR